MKYCIYTIPPLQAGCDTRLIFSRAEHFITWSFPSSIFIAIATLKILPTLLFTNSWVGSENSLSQFVEFRQPHPGFKLGPLLVIITVMQRAHPKQREG